MRFISSDEAATWASRFAPAGSPERYPESQPAGWHGIQVEFVNQPGHRHYWIARELVRAVSPWTSCLLWITTFGVWPSGENLHLYYRFRNSYREASHLDERPALIALKHEAVDVESFLHFAVLFGWDAYLVTVEDYGRVFVSHDGFATVSSRNAEALNELRQSWASANLRVSQLTFAV
jgi:hypothetical protein